jgi:hypothetical protein
MIYPLLIDYMLSHDGKMGKEILWKCDDSDKGVKGGPLHIAHSYETADSGIGREYAKFHGCWPSGRSLFHHPHCDGHFLCIFWIVGKKERMGTHDGDLPLSGGRFLQQ